VHFGLTKPIIRMIACELERTVRKTRAELEHAKRASQQGDTR